MARFGLISALSDGMMNALPDVRRSSQEHTRFRHDVPRLMAVLWSSPREDLKMTCPHKPRIDAG
ncbi:MAG: hypothetical protein K2X32_13645 [Phycisphaerales bacterium]|nr:hypothetical protein [Phycisphaerales bacterium]